VDHQTPLLITLALGFVFAFAFGYLATRLRLPALVGYLVAGIAIGPFSPGFVADTAVATQLAEIGVILLMFGVGLHFSTDDLLAVRWIAIPGAVGQIVVATGIGAAMALAWGWSVSGGLVLGLALSVASTVVVLRALEERGALESVNGRIAIAWLVVEDLAMVLTLVLLPALAQPGGRAAHGDSGSLLMLLALTTAKIAVFLGLVAFAGPRFVPWILQQAARTGSHELFTLAVLAVSLGIAYGSASLFGVSFALGAFCAGVVLSKSELSHRAAEESLPLQHAFAVIFFVSVGMLFDPTIILRQPLALLSVLLVIVVGKSVVAFAIVQVMGYPVGTALTVSASLAQIGEFSFILATLGIELGLMPADGRDLLMAGALFSVTLNPAAFAVVAPIERWARSQRRIMTRFEPAQELRLARLQAVIDAHASAGTRARLAPDELVSRWWVFAGLDFAHRAELLTLFKPRWAVPGERLIRAGDPFGEAFFISSGTVEVAVRGRKIRLGPGDFFGEMALLASARRSADVTAIDYCQFLTLDPRDFERYLSAHDDVRARIDHVAAERAEMNRPATVHAR
jgi:CPA2 family monovalent cation:H+ antiporter-2